MLWWYMEEVRAEFCDDPDNPERSAVPRLPNGWMLSLWGDQPGHATPSRGDRRVAIRACRAGHRVLFATASLWVARLAEAHHAGRLQEELVRLTRYPLLVVASVLGMSSSNGLLEVTIRLARS